jgi:hypothetical protein
MGFPETYFLVISYSCSTTFLSISFPEPIMIPSRPFFIATSAIFYNLSLEVKSIFRNMRGVVFCALGLFFSK